MEWYDKLLPHWPFISVCFILMVIGEIMGSRIFTRPRAYLFRGKDLQGRLTQSFFYWGRELIPAMHIVSGWVIGKYWIDPGGLGWSKMASQMYFTFASTLSMFAWSILKGRAKKAGIVLELPGETVPPSAPEVTNDEVPPSDP